MSDWKKRNEDWRDEDELEEEEECECPWVDSKGKVRETAYCQYLLEKHPMMCLKQKLFDQNGEVDEDALLYEVHSDLRDFVLDNLAKACGRNAARRSTRERSIFPSVSGLADLITLSKGASRR